uniref:CACTA en-spm transposon protein n=1 Tax=Cucumis melo TaxID=3656 RepID=A0A9I9EGU2_CUCME
MSTGIMSSSYPHNNFLETNAMFLKFADDLDNLTGGSLSVDDNSERYVAANGRIPMTIAPGTEKPISSYAIPFSQAIGVCVRKIFSIHCLKWADIDREYIEIVKADLQHLKKFGDDCHRHFKKYSDPEEARANPPNLLEQSWTNKATKQKQPYNHSSGSKSFLQRQHELTKQRGESVDCVELFRETHIRSGTFVLHVVEDVHNQVLELQSQPTPEDYSKSLGWGPKPKARKTISASNSSTSCSQSIEREIQLQAKLDEALEQIERIEKQTRNHQALASEVEQM